MRLLPLLGEPFCRSTLTVTILVADSSLTLHFLFRVQSWHLFGFFRSQCCCCSAYLDELNVVERPLFLSLSLFELATTLEVRFKSPFHSRLLSRSKTTTRRMLIWTKTSSSSHRLIEKSLSQLEPKVSNSKACLRLAVCG